MAQPTWTFGLVDANGSTLADLSMARDRQLTFQNNAPTVVTFTIPLTHIAAGSVEPGRTYVKAYREYNGTRTLEFYGPVWVDEIQTTGAGVDLLRVTAMDPLVVLGKRVTTSTFTATDRGAVLKSIIDTSNSAIGETGIATNTGWIATSSTVTADYSTEQPTILDIIGQYASAQDGCDVAVQPIELAGGKIGQFYVYARRGGSRPGTIFGYGPDTVNNCTSINRVRNADNMANDVIGVGTGTTSEWQNATSQASYRRLVEVISYTSETNAASLSARTRYYLDTHDTPDAVAEYAITCGPDAPRMFTDYDVGDTVAVWFSRGTITYRTVQRVYSASISVDDNGREMVTQLGTRAE